MQALTTAPHERLERQQAKALKKINELRRRCAAQVPYEEVCCKRCSHSRL
jgi:hypothetical protein